MRLVRGRVLLPTIDLNTLAGSNSRYRDVIELSNEGLAIRDIAYVAQEAWLRNATIRENILFGEVYNSERYEEVLRVCALKPDLRILVAGDMTEIGERGVTLSGGQKQRVALARAVYSSCRILLIDDCLSAVDAHTAKHILMECLLSKTRLMRGRTRVLVTYHVTMCLPYAQYMVMINEGRITLKGTPDELKNKSNLSLALLESQSAKDNRSTEQDDDKRNTHYVNDRKPEDEYNRKHLRKLAMKRGIDPDSDLSMLQGILIKDEEREEGNVKFEVWKTFMLACGSKAFWGYIIAVLLIAEALTALRSYWIKLWVASASSSSSDLDILSSTTNEMNMNSVERIMQYLSVEQEAALESEPENKPPAIWPQKGDVKIEDLVVEYTPGVPVLHGISLSAKHGEKVGIVGRTGAGKSSMSLALLRYLEASKGRIVLDGIDISKIGLEDLRRNVTIIPQDPVLFNGTIRFNLDPFDEHPDELLWDALKRTHLVRERGNQTNSSTVSVSEGVKEQPPMLERMVGIFTSLDAEIKENGQNLSQGQRQLVSLARALVKRSKLIVMDEATASVDFDTDNRIQRTIRGPEFANSTLFCVAHRLRTIIDYDKVLVLDNGKVAEFDTPRNLLKNENGIFRSMCEKTGDFRLLLSATTSDC
ncbi:hypothetical protein LPJ81_004100 [Coemansia sp. IMI 209127]|nr:hypothetical protein LPJ81_004100 [Coemansia sp. IMI 209127]